MRFVLDANVALTWFLSEGEAQTAYSLLVLEDAVEGNSCVVPGLWHVEVAARLIRARRNRNTAFGPARMVDALRLLGALDLETHQMALAVTNVADLATRYHLSAYDAVYFHLAKSLDLPIASFDGGIHAACRAHGVRLLHQPD
jgi:predicted nucleic acid-binding protein